MRFLFSITLLFIVSLSLAQKVQFGATGKGDGEDEIVQEALPSTPTITEKLKLFLFDDVMHYYDKVIDGFIPVRRIRTIEDYGAVGDGVFDNTEVFQRALDDTTQTEIILSPGKSYYFTSFIVINHSDKVIRGNGSQLFFESKTVASAGINFSDNVKNILFENITFNSNADQSYDTGGVTSLTSNIFYINASGSSYRGIDNLQVVGCRFINGSTGIRANFVKSVQVLRDSFINTIRPFLAAEPLNVFIEKCYINRDSIFDSTDMTHSIYTNGGNNIVIRDCFIKGGDGQALNIKNESFQKRESAIIKNVVIEDLNGIYLQDVKNVSVTGCTFRDSKRSILVHSGVENVSVISTTFSNSDSLNPIIFFQKTLASDTLEALKIENLKSNGPISIRTSNVKRLEVNQSIITNPQSDLGGLGLNAIDIPDGSFAEVVVTNSKIHQFREPERWFFIRNRSSNNATVSLSNCDLFNETNVDRSYCLLTSGGTNYRKYYINNVRYKGFLYAYNPANPENEYQVRNTWDTGNDQPLLSDRISVGTNTVYGGQRILFVNDLDTLTVNSSSISDYSEFVIVSEEPGGVLRTSSTEQINDSSNDFKFNTKGIFRVIADGSELRINQFFLDSNDNQFFFPDSTKIFNINTRVKRNFKADITDATYSIAATDHFLRFNAELNSQTITLPDASALLNGTVIGEYQCINNSSNDITFISTGGSIDSLGTLSATYIPAANSSFKVVVRYGNHTIFEN